MESNMKKFLAMVLTAALFLTGCGTGEGSKQKEEKENEIPLNIIDDKYRNYYEVFVYSFYDSDGDGIGDLKGLTEKLDYINDGDDTTDTDLGMNGIWLMPIMPSTTYHKYDVTDYYDIDKDYGTMDDFKAFMEECNKRDIHVIIDLVINHTSSKHEWFTTATDYLKTLEAGEEPDATVCPYVDYYHFTREPEGSSYYQVSGTQWYYEAPFWSEMPDLNLGNEAVRKEIEDIVSYWMDLGVAGFRLDAAKEYYSGQTGKNIEVLSWFNDYVKSIDEDAYIVAEVWNEFGTFSQYYESGIDSVFNFAFADSSGIITSSLYQSTGQKYGQSTVTVQEKLSAINPDYIDAPFFTNHDMARAAGYFNGEFAEQQTKMAGAMNLLMSGNAFLYYGEELGMSGSGRDENKRAPMYWSSDESTEGMCDGPSAMETVKHKYGSLEEQMEDENSIYNFYKEIIKIRNQNPEVARGTVTYLDEVTDTNICAVKKEYNGSDIVILMNLAKEEKSVLLDQTVYGEYKIVGAVEAAEGTEIKMQEDNTIVLPAYSVVVLKK
ncbi:MAG: alpha-amylase [Lachnospiraceae bacterium]|nr:alpha-amylase [Lachnospiraceae bacterium]